MSYDDLDPRTKRVLREAEFMRSNEAKLAQICSGTLNLAT